MQLLSMKFCKSMKIFFFMFVINACVCFAHLFCSSVDFLCVHAFYDAVGTPVYSFVAINL